MGNSESQNSEGGSRASSTALPEMRTCYYEILEVERSDATTADDIKRVSPAPMLLHASDFRVPVGLPSTCAQISSRQKP